MPISPLERLLCKTVCTDLYIYSKTYQYAPRFTVLRYEKAIFINDALLNNFIVEWAIYIWTFIVGEPPVSVGLSKKLFTL